MQLQGLMLLFFMLLVIPLMVVFSNHETFFITFSLLLFILSIREVYSAVLGRPPEGDEPDPEDTEELEDLIGLDLRQFDKGLRVTGRLAVILFFVYCSFYAGHFIYKALITLICIYRIYEIKGLLKGETVSRERKWVINFQRIAVILVNVSALVVIAAVFLKKVMFL